MLSLSRPSVNLSPCGCSFSSTSCPRPRKRLVGWCRRGSCCLVSLAPTPPGMVLNGLSLRSFINFVAMVIFHTASGVLSLGAMLGGQSFITSGAPISVSSLLQVVSSDLQNLNNNLRSIVGAENPVLVSAAEQIFGAGGKRLRPALVFLVSRATAQIVGLKNLTSQHLRLAEIIEMIHTASLIHDDVLDDSALRRGKETIHQLYGTRVAVLAGDYMFAQSSWSLANLENIEVIKLISRVIKDFSCSEMQQASSLFNCDLMLDEYLLKSYYKTASLIAASTKAAAIFSGVYSYICEQMYEYGNNLGLSFQVVDDILDFTQSAEQLGKPAASDLAKGNLTAPVIYALEKEPKLREIIESKFSEDGSLDTAIELVHNCDGIKRAQNLAKEKADLAIQSLQCLPESEFRSSLEGMVKYNLERMD